MLQAPKTVRGNLDLLLTQPSLFKGHLFLNAFKLAVCQPSNHQTLRGSFDLLIARLPKPNNFLGNFHRWFDVLPTALGDRLCWQEAPRPSQLLFLGIPACHSRTFQG